MDCGGGVQLRSCCGGAIANSERLSGGSGLREKGRRSTFIASLASPPAAWLAGGVANERARQDALPISPRAFRVRPAARSTAPGRRLPGRALIRSTGCGVLSDEERVDENQDLGHRRWVWPGGCDRRSGTGCWGCRLGKLSLAAVDVVSQATRPRTHSPRGTTGFGTAVWAAVDTVRRASMRRPGGRSTGLAEPRGPQSGRGERAPCAQCQLLPTREVQASRPGRRAQIVTGSAAFSLPHP